jgi:hypothetical protein
LECSKNPKIQTLEYSKHPKIQTLGCSKKPKIQSLEFEPSGTVDQETADSQTLFFWFFGLLDFWFFGTLDFWIFGSLGLQDHMKNPKIQKKQKSKKPNNQKSKV